MTSAYVIAPYIRLSTEDSTTGSFSIENQRRALQHYIDTMEDVKNVEVLEFVDNGYSGTNFERPAVQELLDLVRAGKINCIIVKDFTRFGRNSIDVGYFMEKVFPIYGVRFISLNDNFDSNTLHGDTGGINVAFKYLISEFYSRDLSVKHKSAKYVKFRRGEYQSKICPYGYKKGADGRMEPDEEAAANVQLIFELARIGYTAGEIVRELFERGISTPGEYKAAHGFTIYDISRCSRIWQKSSVLNILKDERYTGTYIIGKREVREVGSNRVRLKDESQWIKIPDHHPAIISHSVFEQVRKRFSYSGRGKAAGAVYPLRKKVFCGCCRHAMPRTSARNRQYACVFTRADKNASCYGLRIAESELDATLYGILSRQAKVVLNLDNLENANQLDIQIARQDDCSKRVGHCMELKHILQEQLMSKEICMDEYKAKKDEIDIELHQLKQLQAAISAQTAQMQGYEKSKNVRMELAQKVTQASGLTVDLAEALIDRIYVYPENQLEIVWKMNDFCSEQ